MGDGLTPGRTPTRELTILAQDPTILGPGGRALTTRIAVPNEHLTKGPRGARLEVIDFDATANVFYSPRADDLDKDPYEKETDVEALESDAHFHAQNVYAITAQTLFAFEKALGRRASWAFPYGTHQLKILPHAFRDANAFYSRRDEALMFGYFQSEVDPEQRVYTCLSRDVVAHEATHALLDGLLPELDRPSSPDQGAFHEGFSDVVALLLVLSAKELLERGMKLAGIEGKNGLIDRERAIKALRVESFLFGLGEEFGVATKALARNALRRSSEIKPSKTLLDQPAYQEVHDRGEAFVAMVLHAYLEVWHSRLTHGGAGEERREVETWRIADEGAKAAEHLLGMMIRALDYLPPAHLTFGDVLSAALTADVEAYPNDSQYKYREALTQAFAAFGVKPAAKNATGTWNGVRHKVSYDFVHHDALRYDSNEVFRFLHENRGVLELADDALTKVESVRPVVRVGDDGFLLRETVAHYFQVIDAGKSELAVLKIPPPDFLKDGQRVRVHGGGTLIFDEFGRLKFHIHNHLARPCQKDRLEEMHRRGALGVDNRRRFATAHLARAIGPRRPVEEWD